MKTEAKQNPAENKNLVLRAIDEIWNKGNYDNLEEFVSGDFIIHSPNPAEVVQGVQGVKQFFIELRKSFPDIQFAVDQQVAEEDRVVTQWTARGTHKGEYKGIPGSGKQVVIKSIDVDRIANGKVVECWSNVDELGLLQQLGVTTH